MRLAWHSSGTYDRMSKTGGSGGGTIRFKEELAHGANAGLDKAVAWLEPVHAAHPQVSYADIYTYAGAIAVEEMGGPAVTWRAGRVDAMTPDAVTPDGRLPEADAGRPEATAAALRKTFGRMGFSDRELVALSGAHALGRCHAENSGYVGPWQGAPTVFSNVYFKLLAKQTKSDFWTPDDRYKQPQFKDKSGTLMMLPSDLVLVQDDAFKKYVLEYAKDQEVRANCYCSALDFWIALTRASRTAVLQRFLGRVHEAGRAGHLQPVVGIDKDEENVRVINSRIICDATAGGKW